MVDRVKHLGQKSDTTASDVIFHAEALNSIENGQNSTMAFSEHLSEKMGNMAITSQDNLLLAQQDALLEQQLTRTLTVCLASPADHSPASGPPNTARKNTTAVWLTVYKMLANTTIDE